MNIKDLHVGQTVFFDGKRSGQRKIIKIEDSRNLIEYSDGRRDWSNNSWVCRYQPIPNDLHDKNGLPLKLGDMFKTIACVQHEVCSCASDSNGMLVVDDDGGTWHEKYITKVEEETLDDLLTRKVRGCMAQNNCGYWGKEDYAACAECEHSNDHGGRYCWQNIAQDIARQAYALGLRDGAK